MKLRLIRHATLQLDYAGERWLIDPMFAPAGQFPSLTFGASASRNPLVPLPCAVDELLRCDVVAVTHTHFDHFDRFAAERLPKTLPIVCQPADSGKMRRQGFQNVLTVPGRVRYGEVEVTRIRGRHGQGLLASLMGASSGYVLQASGEPTTYIAGDTVGCAAAYTALEQFQPGVVIVNSGAAQFNVGKAIVMDAGDVIEICRRAPGASIVAVHMEAINHCHLTRRQLADACHRAGVSAQVSIPQDGEWVAL
ncbi:MAG: MBL fold metallo-hydrolase [Chloroflexota bacterium]